MSVCDNLSYDTITKVGAVSALIAVAFAISGFPMEGLLAGTLGLIAMALAMVKLTREMRNLK